MSEQNVTHLKIYHAAKKYVTNFGATVLPIHALKKHPIWDSEKKQILISKKTPGWEQELQKHFAYDINLGIILGNGILDIDLDCKEARDLAHHYLPHTDAMFGRTSDIPTHYIYSCAQPNQTKQFTLKNNDAKSDADTTVLLEIRGSGHYTVFPPSSYADTGELRWKNSEPTLFQLIDLNEITISAGRLAAAVILSRYWQEGVRDVLTGYLSGALLKADWKPEDIKSFMFPIAQYVNDDERLNNNFAFVDRSYEKYSSGGEIKGATGLKSILGDDATNRVLTWLGVNAESEAIIEEMNENYALIQMSSSVKIAITKLNKAPNLISRADFNTLEANRQITLKSGNGKIFKKSYSEYWLEHSRRRTYNGGIGFYPNVNKCPSDVLNTWCGFTVSHTPIPEESSCDLIKSHILKVLCSSIPEQYQYFMNWLAHIVQKPGEKTRVAIGLKSEATQVGKGITGQYLLAMFHPYGTKINDHKRLTTQFNQIISENVFMFGDEIQLIADSIQSPLKSIITDDEMVVESKYVNQYLSRNSLNIMVASNKAWFIKADLDEKRWFIPTINEERHDKSYFDAIQVEMHKGGPAALYHELLQREISKVDITAAPKTSGLQVQQTYSDKDVRMLNKWWRAVLERGYVYQPKYGADILEWESQENYTYMFLYKSFMDWFRELNTRAAPPERQAMIKFLNNQGFPCRRNHPAIIDELPTGEYQFLHYKDIKKEQNNKPGEKVTIRGAGLGSLNVARRIFGMMPDDDGEDYSDEADF